MRPHLRPFSLWVPCQVLSLVGLAAWAQDPMPPTGYAPPPQTRRAGPIHRAFHHTFHTVQDKFIGYPEEFAIPPFGTAVNEPFLMMKAKADVHSFMLYRSDFLDGTNTLAPDGAQRLSRMASKLPGWLGPLVIEWTPDDPALARERQKAVLAALQSAGLQIGPERIIVGPSPYPGRIGTDAANNYDVMIQRNVAAGTIFPLPPTFTGYFGGGSR